MKKGLSSGLPWVDALQGRLPAGETGWAGNLTDPGGRTTLVAKARWLILLSIGAYATCAASLFFFSRYGFFLTSQQRSVLAISLAGVACYNTLYQFFYERIRHIPYIDHLQIFLDLLFATILIHFSGGGSSWFWAVYLIVTLEASILLERRQEVWKLGALGAIIYGALLTAEYHEIFRNVQMPFVDQNLHRDAFYLTLMWFWVSFLNATMAVVGPYLMTVIRRENAALRQSEQRLVDFLDSAHDLIFSFSPEGEFLYTNRAWKQALGHDPKENPALNLLDIMDGENRAKCLAEFRKAMIGEKVEPIEGRLVARNGRQIAVEGNITCSFANGRAVALWGICRDVTERKQAQEQLYHMAHHDMLTGLPNRMFFLDRLKQAKALAKRLERQLAILFLDLDRFKIINDTLGHPVGDKLLQEIANRLGACLRETDTVARLGGDEFIILLGNLNETEDAEHVARKILNELARPIEVDGHELFITTSIGLALFPKDDDDPLGLIKKADIAMYCAKTHGRNNYQFYSPVMDLDSDKRLVLENSMRRALEREEFCLYYQPKVDISSGRVTAMEALLRWEHPELGLLPPGDFISLAEETGMILPIGEWVLRRACEQNRQWQDEGLPKVRVAVNFSGYQLQQKDLIRTIRQALEESRLDPCYLELEITETVLMQNPEFAKGILSELSELGIHLSIDDFGTGYSSLAHLKRFSVNSLKIDKAFIRDVESNSTDAAIATAIISMGSSLNLEVIAEGVETEGQLTFLREKMCDEIQGFIFSRPVPPEEVSDLLRQRGILFDKRDGRQVDDLAKVG